MNLDVPLRKKRRGKTYLLKRGEYIPCGRREKDSVSSLTVGCSLDRNPGVFSFLENVLIS